MGVLFDYFVAESDVLAASVLDGGPSVAADGREGPAFPFVSGSGIDPFVVMGKLEAALTGRTYQEVSAARGDGEPLALAGDGERMVERLSDALTESLATASPERLAEVAVPWSQAEEFSGQADPAVLTEFLTRLADLVRPTEQGGAEQGGADQGGADRGGRAGGTGHLYCWVCV